MEPAAFLPTIHFFPSPTRITLNDPFSFRHFGGPFTQPPPKRQPSQTPRLPPGRRGRGGEGSHWESREETQSRAPGREERRSHSQTLQAQPAPPSLPAHVWHCLAWAPPDSIQSNTRPVATRPDTPRLSTSIEAATLPMLSWEEAPSTLTGPTSELPGIGSGSQAAVLSTLSWVGL